MILKKKRYQKIKCITCGEIGCFDHCALCGIEIIWRPRLLDEGILYTGIKPLRADNEEPHNFTICQDQHYKQYARLYPKVKACVILCPIPKCNLPMIDKTAKDDYTVEPTNELITIFGEHLKAAHQIRLNEKVKNRLESTIFLMRTRKKIYYLDPFIHVAYDEL